MTRFLWKQRLAATGATYNYTGQAVTLTTTAAQYPAQAQLNSQPSTISLSQPGYLSTVAIPGLQTEVIRISNQSTFGGSRRWYRHRYSKACPWNSNGSKICLPLESEVFGSSGKAYFLNGTTYALESSPTNIPYQAQWSHLDPTMMYGVVYSSRRFVKYFPATNTTTLLHDYSEFTECFLGNGEGNLSNDDHYAPLVGVTGGVWTGITYDTVGNTEIARLNLGGGIDWISMSQSGTYVVLGDGRVYNRNFSLLRTLSVPGGHADLGYDSAGNEVFVSARFEGGTGVIVQTNRLSDDTQVDHLPVSGQTSVPYNSSNYHISCRNIDRPGYAYISTFYLNEALGAVMYREIYALKLDGSGKVERYSQGFFSAAPVDETYAREAQASPNRDGSKILFASDWNNATSGAIIYAYVAGVNV